METVIIRDNAGNERRCIKDLKPGDKLICIKQMMSSSGLGFLVLKDILPSNLTNSILLVITHTGTGRLFPMSTMKIPLATLPNQNILNWLIQLLYIKGIAMRLI